LISTLSGDAGDVEARAMLAFSLVIGDHPDRGRPARRRPGAGPAHATRLILG
jgi:hypothetical protein